MRPDPLVAALFLIAALVIAGLAHSAWLRLPLSRSFCIPIDGGLHLRGRRLFGANKTVRGFMVMIPAAALSFAALAAGFAHFAPTVSAGLWPLGTIDFALLGAAAGLGFMLGELPNSFVKRQLDIAPGTAPRGPFAFAVGFLVDRLDSIVGMLVAVSLVVPTPWMTWVYVIVLGPAIHWSFSVLLYYIGVKARPA
jgi:hypothetical protein